MLFNTNIELICRCCQRWRRCYGNFDEYGGDDAVDGLDDSGDAAEEYDGVVDDCDDNCALGRGYDSTLDDDVYVVVVDYDDDDDTCLFLLRSLTKYKCSYLNYLVITQPIGSVTFVFLRNYLKMWALWVQQESV